MATKKAQTEEFATDRERELATEVARLNELIATAQANGGKLLEEIPGEYRIDGFETPAGKVLSGVVKFKPGKTQVVAFGDRVSTAVLLKVANGEALTAEEHAKNKVLIKQGRAACEALLHKWILSDANHFIFITE